VEVETVRISDEINVDLAPDRTRFLDRRVEPGHGKGTGRIDARSHATTSPCRSMIALTRATSGGPSAFMTAASYSK
jgi:hypothetical protein